LAQADEYEKIVKNIRTNWGMMLEHGATTCWEMFPGEAINRPNPEFLTRSHTHAWSTAPAYFFGTVILGVRSLGNGFRGFVIEPDPCGLQWARGRVPIPGGNGYIKVHWFKNEDETVDLRVEGPEDVHIQAQLPEGTKGTVCC